MGFDPIQLRNLVIRPTLHALENYIPYSEVAVELLMLTAATESRLGAALEQYGGGPALGLYQIEPATHHDVWKSFLDYHKATIEAVALDAGWSITTPQDRWLFSNLDYATSIARIKYRMHPAPLPAYVETRALASYWKLVWNTPLGAGTVEQAITNYRQYVGYVGTA